MFNNGFNNFGGYNSNTFNPASQNLKNGNIAGLKKEPSSIAGIKAEPNSVAGLNNNDMKPLDPFAKVYHDNSGPARQVMNSKGQNIIQNEMRGIKN